MAEEQEPPNQRLQRRVPAPSAAASVRERLTETRGRPSDEAESPRLSREEIAERISDENFQDNPELLTRRKITGDDSQYQIPKHLQKPGWEYQANVMTVLGEPVSSAVTAFERAQGWRPVPREDVEELLPPGYTKPTYEIDGLRWMMRPRRLQVEARNELLAKADKQKQEKLRQALAGGHQHPLMPHETGGAHAGRGGTPIIQHEIGTYRPREDGA